MYVCMDVYVCIHRGVITVKKVGGHKSTEDASKKSKRRVWSGEGRPP